MPYDVAIVGAGYVGLPLAATFAEAGCTRARSSTSSSRVVDAINRGESHIEDVETERLAPLVEQGLVRATTDYDEMREADGDPDRAADAALAASASPTSRSSSAPPRGIAKVLQRGPARRARVDDVARHDARGAAADPRARARA